MADNQPTTSFVYESSRHKALMDEYSRLSTDEQYLDWAKKAPLVAAYMSMTISRVRMAIAQERARLDLEKNKEQQQNIKMGLMQFENFRKILQTQLDQLIRVMDSLPTGSVKPVFEELMKSKMPKPDSPYVKILVTKSGEIILDGSNTSIDVLQEELTALAQRNGVVLYSRESPEEPQPPAIAKTVINLVIENRLPIRMCQKSDFSDAIDSNGKLRIEE